jgi:hypothetical protein
VSSQPTFRRLTQRHDSFANGTVKSYYWNSLRARYPIQRGRRYRETNSRVTRNISQGRSSKQQAVPDSDRSCSRSDQAKERRSENRPEDHRDFWRCWEGKVSVLSGAKRNIRQGSRSSCLRRQGRLCCPQHERRAC